MIEVKNVRNLDGTNEENEVVKTYIVCLPNTNDDDIRKDICDNSYSVKHITNCILPDRGVYHLVTTVVYVPR